MNRYQSFSVLSIVLIAFGAAGGVNIFNHNPNFSAEASKTNATFVTSDGHIYLSQATGRIDPEKIEEAKKSQESLPAKDFPEGNWGELSEGVQVSLRVDKQVYTNGEAINATVLIRNVTNEFFLFLRTAKLNSGNPVNFAVYAESGKIIPSKTGDTNMAAPLAGSQIIVIPGTQRKYVDRLNDAYKLTNGSYLIEASIRTDYGTSANPAEWIVVKSAKVPIEIKK